MIDGVNVKGLRTIPDQRGRLTELVRSDDEDFEAFGQVYMSVTYPGVVKGWHLHIRQTDLISCVSGMILLVLYDDRDGSPTRGQVDEFYLGTHAMERVRVPPGVLHGWKCVSAEEALVINLTSELYNYDDPDEMRVHPHDNDIPYDWSRQDG